MTQIELICNGCNCSFSTLLKRFKYLSKKGHKNFYCSKKCFRTDKTAISIEKICLYCKNIFISTTRSDSKKCCSLKCARKYSQTFTNPKNTSAGAKLGWSKRNYLHINRICKICNKEYKQRYTKCCSIECARKLMSEGARKSIEIQKDLRRSKNEMMFADLCKDNFLDVKVNERIFNGWDADVILQNEKIAVLWNGKWHREKITKKHSVFQVQNRDKIKIDEIRKFGYIPYIINDEGKYNPSFVLSEFEKFKLFIVNGCVV